MLIMKCFLRAGYVFKQFHRAVIGSSKFESKCSYSTNKAQKICVVGAGPAGFYVTQHIVKHLPNAHVDIVEKLPVPFGLVRFGVAPDHPEVKNVINTFTKTAEHPNVRFYGNLSLGRDFSLQELRDNYHAVVLCYGAQKDRKLNIPNEEDHVLSAREFVAWYNGLPDLNMENTYRKIEEKLHKTQSVSIIGQGNVGIDVARILLSPIDELRKTDITERALHALSESKVNEVYLVGRRGPLQAAFTIKELREMLHLPNVETRWRKEDFAGIDENLINKLPRPKRRITDLMFKSLQSQKPSADTALKQFLPIFYRSPNEIECSSNGKKLCLVVNELTINESATPTNDMETLNTDLVLRSIGYKGINVAYETDNLNFDDFRGCIPNKQGRVIKRGIKPAEVSASSLAEDANNFDEKFERGLYVSGWLGTGPVGVILTTMSNSFFVATTICKDFEEKLVNHLADAKPGLDFSCFDKVVTWQQWQQIDQIEMKKGEQIGKPREKILDVNKMLEVAKAAT